MKQLRLFKTLMYGFGLLFLFSSCNSGSTGSDENTAKDSAMADTSAAMTTPTPPEKLADVLIIKHKVANYGKWKTAYDSHDSARLANGLHNFIIGRGADDQNMVIVILKMDDTAKAKALTTSQGMMERMKTGGVMGKPEMQFLNVVMNDTSNIDTKARVMITHKVKDWDAWKKGFDGGKQARMDAGLIDRGLGYSIDDNHIVSIVLAVTDKKKADEFLKSKDLKEKMQEAGVEGAPSFFNYNIVEKY